MAELRRRKVFRVAAVYAGVGFVLVQATAYLFDALLFPEWAHRLFVVFVVMGFPVALVGAWAFELTPEGIRTARRADAADGEAVEAEGPARPGGSRAMLSVAAVAVVGAGVAAAGWAAWQAWLAPEPERSATAVDADSAGGELPATRIAVLYFDDHSEGGGMGHVAAGLTESLIHELNRAPGLDVVSRNGVKPYRNPDVSMDSIARALGAGSLVEGSVEREGDELLVTVQLVDGATASHLLSERVRGHVDAPLEVRDELVEKVAGLLRRELGQEVRLREARAETESSRAWELYHLARDIRTDADSFRREGDAEAARRLYLQADSVLAEAEELDPDWQWPAIQRGEVALALGRLASPEVTGTKETWLERGIEHADRVLSEEPDDAAALELRGQLRYYLAQTHRGAGAAEMLESAERDLRRAVSEDPGRAEAWSRLAYLLRGQARFAEARSAVRRSREADRFLMADRDYLYLRASLALDLEAFEQADRLLREALEQYPGEPAFLYKRLQYLASTASAADDVDRAGAVLERFEAVTRTGPWAPGRALLAAVAARAGDADSARAVLGRLEDGSPLGPDAAANAAYAHLQLGERRRALDLLARFLEANPGQRDYVAREWWWRPLRDHPRFRELVGDSIPASAEEDERPAD
jgi:TolB-like protein/Tfp pilus assembly protein PilF